MKRIILCLSLFAFFGSQAQQINPVPDYVFSNKMSVGRNAVTDTAAYFSIGPRYGAIRGMMPPMVTDTASMSATKRNGLLIFSIQKNKYLYWDSVGSKWAEMAGTAGSAITGSGVAGYMPEFTTSTNLDTTRLYHSAGRFAIGSTTTTNGVFNVYGGRAYFDTSVLIGGTTLFANEAMNEVSIGTTTGFHALTVRTRTQASQPTRGIGLITSDLDSATSTGSRVQIGLNASTGNTTGRIEAFQQFSTAANLFLNPGGGEVIAGTGTDAGNYNFQVGGSIYNTTNAMLAATSGTVSIGTSLSGYKLDVAATSGNGIRYTATSTGNSLYMGDNAGTPFISTANASILQLGTNNTERMRIRDDGEVLIGTTTDAGAYALQVSGSIYNTTGAVLAANSGELIVGTTSSASRKLYVTSNSDVARFEQTASDKNMVIELLHTNPNASGTIREEGINFLAPNTTTRGRITFYPSDTFNVRNYLAFFTPSGSGSNAERMRIANDGEVLIGTTSDAGAYALQVAGAIYNTTGAVLATSSGNVGIGTASPSYKLQVIQATQGILSLFRTVDGADNPGLTIETSSSGTMLMQLYSAGTASNLQFGTNGSERMRIKADGEVLIGTTTDAGTYALQVTGAIYNTTTITTGAPSGGTAKPFKIGAAATVSPTSPNRTIEIEIDGTTYYLHAKTTND